MIFAGLTKNSTAYSPIAQSVEQWTVNPCVPGSSPGWRAILRRPLTSLVKGLFFMWYFLSIVIAMSHFNC